MAFSFFISFFSCTRTFQRIENLFCSHYHTKNQVSKFSFYRKDFEFNTILFVLLYGVNTEKKVRLDGKNFVLVTGNFHFSNCRELEISTSISVKIGKILALYFLQVPVSSQWGAMWCWAPFFGRLETLLRLKKVRVWLRSEGESSPWTRGEAPLVEYHGIRIYTNTDNGGHICKRLTISSNIMKMWTTFKKFPLYRVIHISTPQMLFSYGGSKFESRRLMKKILKSGRYDPRIGEISDTKIYIIEKHSKIIQNLN